MIFLTSPRNFGVTEISTTPPEIVVCFICNDKSVGRYASAIESNLKVANPNPLYTSPPNKLFVFCLITTFPIFS